MSRRRRDRVSVALIGTLGAGALLALSSCSSATDVRPSAAQAPSASTVFRVQVTYTLAAEIQARMALANEYIGGADPAQMATQDQWTALESRVQDACRTAAHEGWPAARADLERASGSGVATAGTESSIFVAALVKAAVAPGSYCPELAASAG